MIGVNVISQLLGAPGVGLRDDTYVSRNVCLISDMNLDFIQLFSQEYPHYSHFTLGQSHKCYPFQVGIFLASMVLFPLCSGSRRGHRQQPYHTLSGDIRCL